MKPKRWASWLAFGAAVAAGVVGRRGARRGVVVCRRFAGADLDVAPRAILATAPSVTSADVAEASASQSVSDM